MTFKNSLITLSLIGLVGLSVWTTLMSYRPQTTTSAQTIALPDAYMEEVSAVIMDKNGKPSMKISTPKMTHYPDDDSAELTTPTLTLYRKSPKPWFITAKNAKTFNGIERVNFWNDVIIHHPADDINPATLIKTLSLTVHPTKHIAETNDHITMTQPNLVVKATGMHADMNTGDIKLLSNARGEYVPNS